MNHLTFSQEHLVGSSQSNERPKRLKQTISNLLSVFTSDWERNNNTKASLKADLERYKQIFLLQEKSRKEMLESIISTSPELIRLRLNTVWILLNKDPEGENNEDVDARLAFIKSAMDNRDEELATISNKRLWDSNILRALEEELQEKYYIYHEWVIYNERNIYFGKWSDISAVLVVTKNWEKKSMPLHKWIAELLKWKSTLMIKQK